MTDATTTTEIRIVGANCPWCLNDTIERLRDHPGVVDAHASMSEQCLRIEHHDVPVEELVTLLHRYLHGTELSSVEPVMIEVDARLAAIHCRHA